MLFRSKGKMIYDNDIEHLRSFFGAYRTIRIQFDRHAEDLDSEVLRKQASEVEAWLKARFSYAKSMREGLYE